MHCLRQICRIIFILSIYSSATAQLVPPDKVRSLTTDDGLPQGFVTGFVQDAKGFIWISTQDGFARYDGHNVKTFSHDEANPASLSSNIIESAILDHENHVWLY